MNKNNFIKKLVLNICIFCFVNFATALNANNLFQSIYCDLKDKLAESIVAHKNKWEAPNSKNTLSNTPSGFPLKGISENVKTQGINPTVTAFAIQPSCTNDIPNSDGYLQLSAVNNGNKINFSQGSTYSGPTDYNDPTTLTINSLPFLFNTGLSNPTGSQDYTIRVFNGTSDCFTDVVVTMNEQDCTIGCDCNEYIYLNEPSINATLKFRVNSDGSITEVINPSTGAHWAEGLTVSPHGLGSDLNGYLYICNSEFSEIGNSSTIYAISGIDKYDCDGNLLEEDYIPPAPGDGTGGASGYATNMYSIGNTLYINDWYRTGYDDPTVFAYDLCTKELLGSYVVCNDNDNELNTWDFHIDEANNKIIINNYHTNGFAVGDLDVNLNGDCIPIIASTISSVNRRGITMDDSGNIYVRNVNTMTKYNSAYESQYTVDLTVNGGSNAWALVYSETTGYLYLASNDTDCISVYDPVDGSYVMQGVANPPNAADNKAVAIQKECCPSSNNIVIDTTLCVGSINETIFLQELVRCNGIICEGFWEELSTNTGLVYNSCNETITVTEQIANGSFVLASNGVGNNLQCGAFKITVNVSTHQPIINHETICDDNGTFNDASDDFFTIALDIGSSEITDDTEFFINYNNNVLTPSISSDENTTIITHPDFKADGVTNFELIINYAFNIDCSLSIDMIAPDHCSVYSDCTVQSVLYESNCCMSCETGNLSLVTALDWNDNYVNLNNTNISLKKPVIFNGTPGLGNSNGYALLSVDGKFEGEFNTIFGLDYAFSPLRNYNFWAIDLVGNYDLHSLNIYPKTGCCGGDATTYRVFISEAPFANDNFQELLTRPDVQNYSLPLLTNGNPSALNNLNTTGRFVRIYLEGSGQLQLVEVEIMGSGNANSSPYQYDWNDSSIGNTTQPMCLASGEYQVTITDTATGCTSSQSVILE